MDSARCRKDALHPIDFSRNSADRGSNFKTRLVSPLIGGRPRFVSPGLLDQGSSPIQMANTQVVLNQVGGFLPLFVVSLSFYGQPLGLFAPKRKALGPNLDDENPERM